MAMQIEVIFQMAQPKQEESVICDLMQSERLVAIVGAKSLEACLGRDWIYHVDAVNSDMPRPTCPRTITHSPLVSYFKPAGIPLRELKEIELAPDEFESLRLGDFEGLYHKDAATRMGISRQTFDRIILRARRKVAEALVNGLALRIEDRAKNTR